MQRGVNWSVILSTFVFSVLVFLVIISLLGPEEIMKEIGGMNPWFLLLAVTMQTGSLIALTFRWKFLIDACNSKRMDTGHIFLMSFAGLALNAVTPSSKMGGEPVRVLMFKKIGKVRLSLSAATIVVEKIVDIAAFSLISLVAIILALTVLDVPFHVTWLMGISFLTTASLLLGLFYVTFGRRIKSETVVNLLNKHNWLVDRIGPLAHYRDRMSDTLHNYYSNIAKIGTNRTALGLSILFSLLYWSFEILRAYVLFMAFPGMREKVLVLIPVIAMVYVITAIVTSVPFFLPGGVGLTEGMMIVLYSSSGIINRTVAGIVTIVDRLISYWLVILFGLPIAWYLGVLSMTESVDEEEEP
jgi:uncharacterized protein (TIRG00374 family)